MYSHDEHRAASRHTVPLVFDTENEPPRLLGTYAGTYEDVVTYEATDSRILEAPQDSVAVVECVVEVPGV